MTDAINPYAAPTAKVADVHDGFDGEVQPLKLFSAKGRIGRLRFLARSTCAYLLFSVVGGVITALAASAKGVEFLPFLMLLLAIPYLVFTVLTAIQRSHDMDWTGWSVFALLIPLVGLLWLFVAGTKGGNRFGGPPPPNTLAVKIGGLLLPIIFGIGMLAAIALPAYQQYVQRAKAAQVVKP